MQEIGFDKEIDACGLKCPLPILRTKKALAEMASGQVLKVSATDASAVSDFAAFARQTGNALLESGEKEGVLVFYLRRR